MLPDLDDWLAGGTRDTIGGHAIFHRQDGPADGRPITLLHGFPTSSHDWAPIVPALAEAGFRVTVLDFLGFGASDKPRDHEYLLVDQATLVEELWQRHHITETALVAHDYGVSVAQELLSRDSGRITAMTWLNGGLYPDLHRPVLMQKLLRSPIGGLLGRVSSERTFRPALRGVLGRPVPDEDLHAMWRAITRDGGQRIQPRLLRYIDERKRNADRWRHALESYGGPTQFIWGPADPVSGGHVLPRLRERLPDARFDVLDEEPVTGHYPQVENPDAVSRALLDFLSSSPPRS